VRLQMDASTSAPLRAQSDHALRKGLAPVGPANVPVFRSELLSPGAIVALQRQAGNSAVVSVLKAARSRHRPLHEASVQRCPGGCAPGACGGHEERDSSDMVVSRAPASGAASGAKKPTPPSCRYTPKELAESSKSGGRAWPRSPKDDALLVYDFIHGAASLRSAHLTFLNDVLTDLRLDTAAPARTISRIIGFSDCIANESINVPIRIKRAGAVRKFLLDKGALPANVGPAIDDTSVVHPGDDSPGEQRDLMRSARLELSALPPPACPPCPEDPRTAGCPACPPPVEKRVCGPNVDSQVTSAWTSARTSFDGMGIIEKFNNCRMLVQPLIVTAGGVGLNQDAFDTWGLFQGSAGWTRVPPWHGSCGSPGSAGNLHDNFDGKHEDASLCSNSVQVGGECWLSGTPNYGPSTTCSPSPRQSCSLVATSC
jgi:hypothetical protein